MMSIAAIRTRPPRLVPLQAALLLAALLMVSCANDDPVQPTPSTETVVEDRVLELVNQHRAEKGLGALTLHVTVVEQARAHSRHMAAGPDNFNHDGFQDRVDAINKVVSISLAGENIAFNSGLSDPGRVAFDAWLKSDGHRANIEGDFDITGIGVVKTKDGIYYLTQIFARRN
jgi:uncharacterized protein YkwD